jgi:microcystin-dependent protein
VGNGLGAAKVPLAGLTVTSAPVTGSVTVDTNGSGQAFSIMNPMQAVNFMICTNGYFPSST